MSDQPAPQPDSSQEPDLLRKFLSRHDEPCPACNYNLRGLTGQTCPECGERLRLRIGLVEPHMAHFIAGLLGLASGFGFHAVLLVWLSIILATRRGAPGPDEIWPVPLGTVVLGAGTWWWIRRRVWVRRRPPGTRAALLIAAWGLSIATVTLFLALVD